MEKLNLRHRLLCVLLLVAAAIVFHRAVLFRADLTFPWDFRSHHLPLATAYADALHEGHLPLWDPYTYCGRPLLANPQTATFYPGMLLAVLPGRDGLLDRLEWLAVLHVALAGIFTFFLALRLGRTEWPALFAGLAFELGGFFASQAEHLSAVLGGAWLAGAWYAATLPSRRRIPLLALAWTMSFFIGFTAVTLMTVVSTLLFILWITVPPKALRDFVIAGALSLAMACIQLGPSLELARQSVGQYRTDWMKFGGGIPLQALASLVVPNYFRVFDLGQFHAHYDPTLLYEYSGIMTLLLAAAVIWKKSFRLAGLCLCCLVLMAGENTFIARLIYAASPKFVENTIYWYVFLAPFLLSLALMAAEGLSYFKRLQVAACVVVAAELILVSANRPLDTQSLKQEPVVQAGEVTGSKELVARVRELAGDLRVDTANDSLDLMTGAPILRWRAANGYDPLALEKLIQVRLNAAHGARWGAYYQIEQPDSPALDWMSVRVLTSRTELHTARLQKAGNVAGRWLYVNPSARPRYRAPGCILTNFAESSNRVQFDAECQQVAALETSEPSYSAWRASIDDSEAPITLVHQGFRGLALPQGRHRVTFFYSMRLLAICSAVSGLAWLIWLGMMLRKPKT